MNEIDLVKIKEISLNFSRGIEGLGKRAFLERINVIREPRIKILRGFRGVGKTTALLQLLGSAQQQRGIYLSMDHPYIENFGLYEIGKELVKNGYSVIMADEAHHYSKWERDAKALYDEFPNTSIVISGSAPLAFKEERRYEIIEVEPMSLREFVSLQGKNIESTESWKNLDNTLEFLASNNWIYEYFEQYTNGGAFPIYYTYKDKTLGAIYNSIRKSIREDALFFSHIDGEMIRGMERAIALLATASLGEFSINSMSKHLELTKYRAYEIIRLLNTMKILRIVLPYGKGPKLVRGEPKVMFYHPNLRSAVCDALGFKTDTGAVREELAVFSLIQRHWKVSTIKGLKKSPDYLIQKENQKIIVEIGGPSKNKIQLKGFDEEVLVITERQLIPLTIF